MKILLCGEGPHDVGRESWSTKKGAWDAEPGWLQPLVTKLASDTEANGNVEFEIRERRELTLLPRISANFKPLPPGHGKKALAAALMAKSLGAKVVVFMVDADSNRSADMDGIRHQIRDGFTVANDASLGSSGVACVPMSTSESWLLADASAWISACGTHPTLPKNPEMLWGTRDDPDGDHPKHYFRRSAEAVGLPDSPTTRGDLAAKTDIDVLAASCPNSFAGFATELRAVLDLAS